VPTPTIGHQRHRRRSQACIRATQRSPALRGMYWIIYTRPCCAGQRPNCRRIVRRQSATGLWHGPFEGLAVPAGEPPRRPRGVDDAMWVAMFMAIVGGAKARAC
jgi:hypothetical protein